MGEKAGLDVSHLIVKLKKAAAAEWYCSMLNGVLSGYTQTFVT